MSPPQNAEFPPQARESPVQTREFPVQAVEFPGQAAEFPVQLVVVARDLLQTASRARAAEVSRHGYGPAPDRLAFGPVHSRVVASNGKVRPCRPRRYAPSCPHGRPSECGERHAADDSRVGEPVCGDCYDYNAQAVWNLHAGELWRRTTITLNRHLKAAVKDRDVKVRLSYAKVAKYQRRGVVHFHALIRLDGLDLDNPDNIISPDPSITPELLRSYIETAAIVTRFTTAPHPKNRSGWALTWGSQIDIRWRRVYGSASCWRSPVTTSTHRNGRWRSGIT
ncbi:hypothetical protein Atai01_65590 [Amycolatopsis taiwanensis]|uniref:Replication initiation protein n=1 Tax=Amycolatopsis taiwanensis TaxID=342230 RepID=A0A9W6R9L3_9PSEU|nr:hypothetical protein Atai01_65590 [Amycolatopsis taiwanensis]